MSHSLTCSTPFTSSNADQSYNKVLKAIHDAQDSAADPSGKSLNSCKKQYCQKGNCCLGTGRLHAIDVETIPTKRIQTEQSIRLLNTCGCEAALYLSSLRKSSSSTSTYFQPSGSVVAKILVLIPGIGPGSRVILPPAALICSALLYTSCTHDHSKYDNSSEFVSSSGSRNTA